MSDATNIVSLCVTERGRVESALQEAWRYLVPIDSTHQAPHELRKYIWDCLAERSSKGRGLFEPVTLRVLSIFMDRIF